MGGKPTPIWTHFILHQNKKRRPISRGKRRKGIRLSRRAPSEALRDASPLLFPRRRRCAPSSLMPTGIPCGIAILHCDVLQRGETLCSFCAANDGYKNTYKQTKKGIQKKGAVSTAICAEDPPASALFYSLFSPFFRGLISKPPRVREKGNSIFVKISSILYYHLLNKGEKEEGEREKGRSFSSPSFGVWTTKEASPRIFLFFFFPLSPIDRHASKEAAALQRRCCRLCRSHHVRRGPLDALGRGRGEGAGSRPRAGPRLGGSRAPP